MADCCTNLEVYDIVISSHEDDHELTTKFITEAEENIPKIKIAILSDLMEENPGMDKYDILDGAIENSSFLVLFVSSKVLGDKDGFRSLVKSTFISAAIEDESKKWCFIPVWVDWEKSMRKPRVVGAITGIYYKSGNVQDNKNSWRVLKVTLEKKSVERQRKLELWRDKRHNEQLEKDQAHKNKKALQQQQHEKEIERQKRQHQADVQYVTNQSSEPKPSVVNTNPGHQRNETPVNINLTILNNPYYDPMDQIPANSFAPPPPDTDISSDSFASGSQVGDPNIRVESQFPTSSSSETSGITHSAQSLHNTTREYSDTISSTSNQNSSSAGDDSSSARSALANAHTYTAAPHQRSVSNSSLRSSATGNLTEPSQDGGGSTHQRFITRAESEGLRLGQNPDQLSDEKVDVPSPVYNLETIPHNTNLNTSHNDFPSKPMSMTPCTELVTRTDEVSLLSLAPSHQHPESSIAQGMAAGEPHTTYSSTCSTETTDEGLQSQMPSQFAELAFSGNSLRQPSDEPKALTERPPY